VFLLCLDLPPPLLLLFGAGEKISHFTISEHLSLPTLVACLGTPGKPPPPDLEIEIPQFAIVTFSPCTISVIAPPPPPPPPFSKNPSSNVRLAFFH